MAVSRCGCSSRMLFAFTMMMAFNSVYTADLPNIVMIFADDVSLVAE